MSKSLIAVLLLAGVLCMGCGAKLGRDSRYYTEEGRRHMDAKRWKDASIALRKAIQKDAASPEAHILLARVDFAQGAYPRAAANMRHALTLQPENHALLGEAGEYYLHVLLADPAQHTNLATEIRQLAGRMEQGDPSSFEAARLRGYLHLIDRDFRQATVCFRKAYERKPGDAETALALVRSLSGSEAFPEAEGIAAEALRRHPKDRPLYDALYLLYTSRDQGQKAESLLRARIRNLPADPEARLQLAYHYRHSGQPAAEEAVLQDMLRAPLPDRQMAVGDYYRRAGQLSAALARFEQGLAAEPAQAAEYRLRIVNTLAALGRYDEASRRVEQYLSGGGEQDRLLAVKGVLLLHSRRRADAEEAVKILRRLVRKDEDNAGLHFDLGRASLAAGDPEAARIEWKQALRLQPASEAAPQALAELALQEGNSRDALHWATLGLSIREDSVQLQHLRTVSLLEEGKLDQARQRIEADLLHAPQSRDLLRQKGLLLLAEKKYAEAEALFGQLHQSDRDDLRALRGLFDACVRRKAFDRAGAVLQAETARAPGRDPVEAMLGELATASGNPDVAAVRYAQLVTKHPDQAAYQFRLGEALYRAGRLPEATAALRKTVQLTPGSVPAQLSYAWLLTRSRQLDEAEVIYRSILKKEPRNLVALTNLAEVILPAGKHEEALQLVQRAQQEAPANPQVAQTLGVVYLESGNAAAASRTFENLVKRFPGDAGYLLLQGRAESQAGRSAQARQTLQKAALAASSTEQRAEIESYLTRIN